MSSSKATRGFHRVEGGGPLPAELHGAVAAIGNFDGVHRGHQAVLQRALEKAAEIGRPALVMTFEPHPRSLFRPDVPLFRLTPAPVRAAILKTLGFDGVLEQPFTSAFASITAGEFVEDMLRDRLGISHAVTGFDFHFGRGREGNPDFLAAAGERFGFGVTRVEGFRDEGGQIVSSSRIRRLLEQGEVSEAAGLLGYRFRVEAEVSGGRKLGRTLGFPTANMTLPPETALRHGIYAVRFTRPNGDIHDGVASFGRRPTVEEEGGPLLETFLFDFDGDLYGETCAVSFFGYLRPELKFDGLDALTAQMRRDAEEAKALLSGVRPLGALDLALSFAPQPANHRRP